MCMLCVLDTTATTDTTTEMPGTIFSILNHELLDHSIFPDVITIDDAPEEEEQDKPGKFT